MKKKANKKGFTIMEMLIVVAIIAVLVAIAIPTFNGALTKSKEATDVANVRAAYAEVMVANLTDDTYPASATAAKAAIDASVNANGGYKISADKLEVTGTDGGTYTITYTTTKLKNSNGTTSFTWKMEPATGKITG